MKAFLREVLAILVLATAIFFLTQATVHRAEVRGSSMESNLHNGQILLISRVVYNFHEPERGDIIVFNPPTSVGSDYDYIKRIIGLPGEAVEIKEGIVYIHKPDGNVFALDELNYIDASAVSFRSDIMPADNYFVLGDNRNNSTDSRAGWTVTREDIVGKAWLSTWPPVEWGLAPNYSPILTAAETMSK